MAYPQMPNSLTKEKKKEKKQRPSPYEAPGEFLSKKYFFFRKQKRFKSNFEVILISITRDHQILFELSFVICKELEIEIRYDFFSISN